MKKKVLSAALIAAMVVASQTQGTLVMIKADEIKAQANDRSGTCGAQVTWEVSDDGTLKISGSGEMYHYDVDEVSPWNEYRYEIEKIVIGEGVTNIGSSAFSGCSSLSNVGIPSSTTSIGDSAFSGCSNLERIVIPSGVTSIGWGAFEDCYSLISVQIPSGVTSLSDHIFSECISLTSVELPSGVTDIGSGAFEGCSSLEGIKLPIGITRIGNGAFSDCTSLAGIEIPSGITKIEEEAFCGCTGLLSIEIPAKVTSIGDSAFLGCTGLTSIKIPSSVTAIGDDSIPNQAKLFVDENSYAHTYATTHGFGCEVLTVAKKEAKTLSLSATEFTYNGKEIKPDVTVKDAEGNVISVSNYKVEYKNNINAGAATVTVTMLGNYVGTITKSFTIHKAEAKTLSLSAEEFIYNGKEIKPDVTVKDAGEKEIGASDYKVEYSNNINAGEATVQVTMSGNYAGTLTKTFTIRKAEASTLSLSAAEFTYNGKEIKPNTVVKSADGKVIATSNYKVEYSNNVNVGQATVKVTMTGNYVGTLTQTFMIHKAEGNVLILPDAEYTYNGSEIKPEITVTDGEGNKIAESSYKVEYINNINAGVATVKVTMSGGYEGVLTKTFTIKKAEATTLTLSAGEYIYNGREVKPEITVKDEEWNVIDQSSYQVEYSNNINAGKATVKVTMSGNYTGTLTETFEIKKAEAKMLTLSSKSYTYNGKAMKPVVTVKDSAGKVISSSNYTVVYSNNINAGKATVKVVMKKDSNFTGTRTATFTIAKAPNKLTVTSTYTRTASIKVQSFQLNAKATGGKLTYKSSSKSVKVSSSGKVTIPKNFAGKVTIKITASGANHKTNTKNVTITVKPATIKITSVTNSISRKATVKWSKLSYVSGYQIAYGTKSNFSGAKTVTVTKASTVSKILPVTKGKTYYVRIRAYKTVGKTKIYGSWSAKKPIKIRK